MPDNYTYLAIDLGALCVPLLFSFHPKLKFHRSWRYFWPACLISAVLFIGWDMLYTSLGVWGFNSRYLTGIQLGNLPLEEVLFFVCIPYASLFTYHCFRVLLPRLEGRQWPIFSFVLILLSLVMAALFVSRLYTGVTFILLTLLLTWLSQVRRSQWLSLFFATFAVILVPFFIVNGLLTGTGLEEPVVWYNNNENVGVRLLTIPVEDIFYGMLLLLLNTALFEQFRTRHEAKADTGIPL